MEQKDYILREIEKIGTIVRAILGRITGDEQEEAITVGHEFEQTTEWMEQQINFSMKKVLTLEKEPLKEYIVSFKGFNVANMELLAEIFYQTGIHYPEDEQEKFLLKALQLYELCSERDHTYSFTRESKMNKIRGLL
ncbi:MAG: hypothetical protein IH595_06210 [Bacteroidales bacterium]|nr:hypothetical protein [Bacteroidales bacterium]